MLPTQKRTPLAVSVELVMSWTKFKVKKGKRANTPKLGKTELRFFALLIYHMGSIYIQRLLFITLIVSVLFTVTSSKSKKIQRAKPQN
jgi:hypothetical protein